MVYSNAIQQNAFGMATSLDGINFTKQSVPFFTSSNSIKHFTQISYPNYRKLNNEYRIYYTAASASGDLTI